MVDPLWIDFANSDWHDWRSGQPKDKLFDETWRSRFLDRWHFDAPLTPTAEEFTTLQELRDSLRAAGLALAGGSQCPVQAVKHVNHVLQSAPITQQLVLIDEGYALQTTRDARAWMDVMARVAESFAEMLAEGDTRRIRICQNDDCRWLFYDTTRNQSKRYCEDATCGNLMKVRRFRAKQKGSAGG